MGRKIVVCFYWRSNLWTPCIFVDFCRYWIIANWFIGNFLRRIKDYFCCLLLFTLSKVVHLALPIRFKNRILWCLFSSGNFWTHELSAYLISKKICPNSRLPIFELFWCQKKHLDDYFWLLLWSVPTNLQPTWIWSLNSGHTTEDEEK